MLLQCAATMSQSGLTLTGAIVQADRRWAARSPRFCGWLLRFDVRMVPAFLATGIVLSQVLRAAQLGTPAAYAAGAAAIAAIVALVVGW